jgi:hypothetical protein
MWQACGMAIVHRELWLANMKERESVEDLDIDGEGGILK